MEANEFITVNQLCSNYNIEVSFIEALNEIGLIELVTFEQGICVHENKLTDVERMIRIHIDLNVNIEGIDVIFNLLQKVDELENDLLDVKNKLMLYESM